MDDLIEMLRRLAEWPDEADPVTIGAIAGEAAAALEAAREDTARLDWLEGETHPGIRLHSGNFHSDEHIGLGTATTGRTLRQAIDAAREDRNG